MLKRKTLKAKQITMVDNRSLPCGQDGRQQGNADEEDVRGEIYYSALPCSGSRAAHNRHCWWQRGCDEKSLVMKM